jgi:methylenetetrahydrofolate dehydrogenase (NADP+)/methenyltetrahydrofolate cyclohydrolase
MEIIDEAKKDESLKGKLQKVVVVGSSGMVGRPLVKELKEQNYDVVACDTKTTNLREKTLEGDILVSTTGIPNLITGDMVKDGAVVIDVGSPGGDIDFPEVFKKASFVTPVPGGVGPVTITCLLENLISAC